MTVKRGHRMVTATCETCGQEFQRRRLISRPARWCSDTCRNRSQDYRDRRAGLKPPEQPRPYWTSVYYRKERKNWQGMIVWRDGRKAFVTGVTEVDATAKLQLRANGVQVGSQGRRLFAWTISPETVRYALSLLQPLDHAYRVERQAKAIAILEQAIMHAEARVEYEPDGLPNVAEQGGMQTVVRPERLRPAWLAALPLGQVQ